MSEQFKRRLEYVNEQYAEKVTDSMTPIQKAKLKRKLWKEAKKKIK